MTQSNRMKVARRSVLCGLGALPVALAARSLQVRPDIILYNARIWTGSAALPSASALAISGGRVLAVGDNKDVLRLAAATTRKIDLGWKRVTPGIYDAHSHPVMTGVSHKYMVACDKSSLEDILAALRERAKITPPGQWVLGFLYDDAKTPRALDIHDLDAALPDHPVRVWHRGGHSNFLNTRAMKLIGYDDTTPSPAGGLIERNADCKLTGKIADNANAPLYKLTALRPTPEDWRDGATIVGKLFNSNGITSTCDAGVSIDVLRALQDARDAGALSFRVYGHIYHNDFDAVYASGVHTGLGDELVRIGGLKLVADGSVSERTAWLAEPYARASADAGAGAGASASASASASAGAGVGAGVGADADSHALSCACCQNDGIVGPGAEYHGTPVMSREQLYEQARKAHLSGWQVATHANGERGIDAILGVYEQLQGEAPRRDPRFRLEHCTVITDDLIRRMKALSAIPIPFGPYVYFHGSVLKYYGKERLARMFAMRTFVDAGLRPASSSDYGASPAVPMMWFYSQLTRKDRNGQVWGENQRITMEEAMRCATVNGAYSSREESIKGTLEPGKLADLVVWSEDFLKMSDAKLLDVRAERTMLGGQWVHES